MVYKQMLFFHCRDCAATEQFKLLVLRYSLFNSTSIFFTKLANMAPFFATVLVIPF